MNVHQITCRMATEAAAIERLCQVIRIRGFRVEALQLGRSDDSFHIDVTVSGERPLGMLLSQIEKLHTVLEVATDAAGKARRAS